jgi:hypothetical protein
MIENYEPIFAKVAVQLLIFGVVTFVVASVIEVASVNGVTKPWQSPLQPLNS